MIAVQRPISCHIGQKLLLRRGSELLVLKDAVGKHQDFPGGRINDDILQNMTIIGLMNELKREVAEEISERVIYRVNSRPLGTGIHMRRDGNVVFLIYYSAEYESGNITLSAEHESYKWVNLENYDINSDEWVPSVKEFLINYLVNLSK